MKIAIVTAFPRDPQSPQGGVEAVSVNLVRGLASHRDLDVHVITADAAISEAESIEWGRVRIHRVPRRGGRTLLHALGDGKRSVEGLLHRLDPDIVHAHDTYGLMVGNWPGPRIFTVHGIVHEDTRLSEVPFARLRAGIWKWIEARLWARQAHIISISPYVRERLRGACRGVIHDIENPIGPEFFGLARAEVEGRILCAGAICHRKNALALMRSVVMLNAKGIAFDLRLAGPVEERNYAQRIQAYAVAHGVQDRVHFLGNLPVEALRKELSTASVFALVSLEECSPMGIEEAMAAGVPVVASNRCGMPYMVRDEETGFLVDPHNPTEVANRLELLLGDPAMRERMGAAAIDFALERFHVDRVAERTLSVYRRVISEPYRGSVLAQARPRITAEEERLETAASGRRAWPAHEL